MRLVSACLVGFNCNYKGESNRDEKLVEMLKNGELVPICPEQLGGFTTPRKPAECGDGKDVLEGKKRIKNIDGNDVTNGFLKGAYETLKITQDLGIKEAILKQKSPSCGCGKVLRWYIFS